MHICFLTPEYPHEFSKPSGGLGTSIKNLADGLINTGQRVSIIVYGQSQENSFQENGIQFYFLKQIHYKIGGWWFYRKYLQKFLNDLIRIEKIDLVEAPDWTGITAFINLACPIVIRLNGSDGYFCHLEGRPQKWKNRIFEKTALKKADILVSVSKFTAEKTNEIFNLNRNFAVIPNSIKTESFRPVDNQIISGRILYFGTLIRKKGVLELASIFNEVCKLKPKVELMLIGKDVNDIFEKRSTKSLIQEILSVEAGRKTIFKSEVPYTDVQKYIQEAQVVVLPSFAEALPMTWLEAMSMEKALVTSNIGWASEVMVDGTTGFTVNPTSHKAYANRIVELIDNPEMATKMGQNARKKVVAEFSSSVVAQQNLKFYSFQLKG